MQENFNIFLHYNFTPPPSPFPKNAKNVLVYAPVEQIVKMYPIMSYWMHDCVMLKEKLNFYSFGYY